ncbi:hypothetical protein DH2020_036800 [Rehmannia glutinosa]|uniref:Uncharacterized protein n=1 Tax=Rehmannia glutinosa TaxID=99300 RepID=A0ABR0V2N0_REHGL
MPTTLFSKTTQRQLLGVLARKAKAILDDDNVPYQSEYLNQTRPKCSIPPGLMIRLKILRRWIILLCARAGCTDIFHEPHWGHHWKCFGGRTTIVENKTADFIQETRKIQIRRKGNNEGHNFVYGPGQQSPNQTSQEDQLKASRDVAMATAAKAKLLLRELKTVKADLAFAKQRCSQLEEENKILREAREKGVNPADDDMIRLQLETLLAEKARLAHENSVYARENRFLREIVEYHQLTMQDVVYLDEGIEEVTEVYPIPAVSRMLSVSPPSPRSPRSSTSLNSLSRSSSSISLRDKPDIPSASTTPRPPPPTQE